MYFFCVRAAAARDCRYVGSMDTWMYALDGTGALRWRFPTGGYVRGGATLGPDAATVYFGSYDRSIYCLNASSGEVLWSHGTNGPIDATPALGPGGVVVVGSWDRIMVALAPDTGAVQWRVPTGNYIGASSACVDAEGTVYFPSYDKLLYAVDGVSGAVLWTFLTKDSISGSPVIARGGVVVLGGGDGTMYALIGAWV